MNLVDALIESQAFVFPTFGFQKTIPEAIRGKTWQGLVKRKEVDAVTDHFLMSTGRSGAALCPWHTDQHKLLIIAFDNKAPSCETAWERMTGLPDIPSGCGVVRTPSGSYHYWFKLPEGTKRNAIPPAFDLGNGMRGEVRSSMSSPSFIMLPGSKAMDDSGTIGEYSEERTIVLDELAEVPADLIRSITLYGAGQSKHKETADATASRHVVTVLNGLAPGMAEEDVYERARSIAYFIGASAPRRSMGDDLEQEIWSRFKGVCDDAEPKRFLASLNAGWKEGRRTARDASPNNADPTASEILAEAVALFGGVPWMVEKRDSLGAAKELWVGIGGSPSRKHEAHSYTRIRNTKDLLNTLVSMTGVPHDTVFASPMYRYSKWQQGLIFYVTSTKVVEYLSAPPQEIFLETVRKWAVRAANDLRFCIRIVDWTKLDDNKRAPFIYYGDTAVCLVIPPSSYEDLSLQIGSAGEADKVIMQYARDQKYLPTHHRKIGKSTFVSLADLGEKINNRIGEQFSEWSRMQDNED